MSLTLLTGGNIVNVELVKVVTVESTPKTYYFKTSTKATFTPSVSAGVEKEQRIKNAIMGLIRTEDVAKGYDIDIEDQRLLMEIFAMIDGGATTMGTGDNANKWQTYTAPVAGNPVTRTKFALTLYTSDRDSEGDVVDYYSWEFPGCKGSPVSGGAQDDDFQTITYNIKSRPATGTSPLTVTRLASLPNS